MSWTISGLEEKLIGFADSFRRDVNVQYEISVILADNYAISSAVKKKPEIYAVLRNTYQQCFEENRSLHEYSAAIDNVDRFLGPLQSAFQFFGAGLAFYMTKVPELAVKAAFAAHFYHTTKNFASVILFAVNELAGLFFTYGSLVEVLRIYENSVKGHIRDNAAERFIDQVLDVPTNIPKDKFQPAHEYFQNLRNSSKF
ncbi:MAG: hypothetical protein ABIF10_04365 [Candidatus Woesearchaeota archaeon]